MFGIKFNYNVGVPQGLVLGPITLLLILLNRHYMSRYTTIYKTNIITYNPDRYILQYTMLYNVYEKSKQ